MIEYLLNSHVYLRLTGEGAVLLDLRRDEYVALNQEQVAVLGGIVRGWPAAFAPGTRSSVEDDGRAVGFVSSLLERGLVTADTFAGKRAAQAELEPAETSMVEQDPVMTAFHAGYVTNFLRACVRTSLSLRLRSLEQVIAAIDQRKRAHVTARRRSASETQDLLNAFMFMRPFLYTPKDHCLFDSLALMHFLSTYQVFPYLVFGVRTNPFEAHSWVQEGRCAFNSPAEYVRAFSPIVVI